MTMQLGGESSDDLLQPTVSETSPRTEKPWNPHSQIWVAFFGGVLAVTTIAILNATRLRMPASSRRWMLIIGAVALCAVFVTWMRVPAAESFLRFAAGGRELRLIRRVIAVVACLAFTYMQRHAKAHYEVFAGDYESLWRPGLIATFVLGTLESLTLATIAWGVR